MSIQQIQETKKEFIKIRMQIQLMPTLTVDLPIDISKKDLKIAIAVQLYREGKLTLKQAADLADFCIEDFMKILSEKCNKLG